MLTRRTACIWLGSAAVAGCARGRSGFSTLDEQLLGYESFDRSFASLIESDQPAELLATGYRWAEGPAWDRMRQVLYFTDVPANRAYIWGRQSGVRVFLDPSGIAEAEGFREPGANGLLVSRKGQLLLCNHGRRTVESMDIVSGKRTALVNSYQGKRFNSPNDVVEASDGSLYFTDPPYGLKDLNDSPLKEMSVNGVYWRSTDGSVARIVDDMTFPNGIALSPDERFLYIAQSDPNAPLVRRYHLSDMRQDDSPWFDARLFSVGHAGLPDGMAIATTGHVFLAGPGGVLILDPEGQCLGRISTGRATANCTFGEDGYTLFITAQDRLLRLRTKVRGVGQF